MPAKEPCLVLMIVHCMSAEAVHLACFGPSIWVCEGTVPVKLALHSLVIFA